MTTPIPRLDIAPKLNRPLSLWNPLDYLRLLYWVFFFPQALRWYVDKFATHAASEALPVKELRQTVLQSTLNDPIQRSLFVQALLLTVIVPVIVSGLLQMLGVKVDWFGVMGGVGLGVVGGVLFGVLLGVGLDVVGVVGFGVASGVLLGVALGVLFGVGFGVRFGVALGVLFGVALGVWLFGAAGGAGFGVGFGVWFGVLFGVGFGVWFGVALGVLFGVGLDVVGVVGFGVALGVVMPLMIIRLPDYVLFTLPSAVFQAFPSFLFSRTTLLPYPGLRKQLRIWLQQDVQLGIANANELFTYSFQFIPVIGAMNDWLDQIPESQLLPTVDILAFQHFDWGLLGVGSDFINKLSQQILDEIIDSVISETSRKLLQVGYDSNLRLDTSAHAACAGYWHLHWGTRYQEDLTNACLAFEKVRILPYGEILYQSVLALHQGHQVNNLGNLVTWGEQTSWLNQLAETPLRPQAVATLQRLRQSALEAAVAAESISKLNRSAALGRAVAALTQLLADGKETCPELEWPIIEQIATQWREILSLAAGEAGQIAITKPVTNPFVVGNPVTGAVFVGRDETFQRLEELWGSDPGQSVPSVVLFGHRRMGKSSILQNLGKHRFGVATLVAQCTMQRVGKLAHTGELLHYLAVAMYDALIENSNGNLPLAEPQPADFQQAWYPAFNRFLRTFKQFVGSRRMILTLDEFELVEREIAAGRVEPELLEYLRGIIHSEPWLILALAGLHTLEEMTADYWNPLFASVTPVRVSFLSAGASAQLLANPSDDFPLDFTRETADHVYGLVKGQPYLTQLVGHTLVRRYNRLVFEEDKPRAPRFTIEYVDAVVGSPEFYEQGSYYFNGVWEQAEKAGPRGQVAILKALAGQDVGPQAVSAIFANANLVDVDGQESLKTLLQHDVVQRTQTGEIDFAVPLMRRWIRDHKLNNG